MIDILNEAIAIHGVADHIRSNNGLEFILYAIQDWLGEKARGVRSRLKTKPAGPAGSSSVAAYGLCSGRTLPTKTSPTISSLNLGHKLEGWQSSGLKPVDYPQAPSEICSSVEALWLRLEVLSTRLLRLPYYSDPDTSAFG